MWFYFVIPTSYNLTSSRIVLNVRVRKAKDLGGHKTLAVKESKIIILTRIHPMERISGHGLPLSLVYASPSRLRFRPYTAIEHQKFYVAQQFTVKPLEGYGFVSVMFQGVLCPLVSLHSDGTQEMKLTDIKPYVLAKTLVEVVCPSTEPVTVELTTLVCTPRDLEQEVRFSYFRMSVDQFDKFSYILFTVLQKSD